MIATTSGFRPDRKFWVKGRIAVPDENERRDAKDANAMRSATRTPHENAAFSVSVFYDSEDRYMTVRFDDPVSPAMWLEVTWKREQTTPLSDDELNNADRNVRADGCMTLTDASPEQKLRVTKSGGILYACVVGDGMGEQSREDDRPRSCTVLVRNANRQVPEAHMVFTVPRAWL